MVGDLAGDQPKMHVMAYSPLRGAPWGLAIGSSEGETFAVADEGRRTVVRLGAAALAAIVVGAMLAGAISGTR